MSFQLDVYRNGETLFIRVSGRVVLDECERFKASCVPYVQAGVARVAVDMSEVEFIDSAGLGVLVGLKMTCNKVKAKMSIVSPSQGVADILYVSKLDGIFDVVTAAPAELLRGEVALPEYRVGPGGAPQGMPAPMPLQPAAPPPLLQAAAPPRPGAPAPLRPAMPGAPPLAPQAPPAPQPMRPPMAAPGTAPMMAPPPAAPPARPAAQPAAAPSGSIQPMGGVRPAPGSAQPGRIAPMGGGASARPGAMTPLGGAPAARPADAGFAMPDEPLFAPPIGDPTLMGPDSGMGEGAPDLLGGGSMPADFGSFAPDHGHPNDPAPVGFMEDIPLPDDMPDLLAGPMPELESSTLDEALGGGVRGYGIPPRPAPGPGAAPRPPIPSSLRPPAPGPRPIPRPHTPTSPGLGDQPMISPMSGTLDEVPMLRSDSITPLGTPIGGGTGGGQNESLAKTPKEMVELHCQRAFEYMRQGAYEESIREYKRALEYNADYLPALNNLAIVFEKKPSWHAQAIEQWERVYQLSKMKGDQKHIDRAQKHLASLRKMQ